MLETLRSGRWVPLELRLADDLPAESLQVVEELARERGVPTLRGSATELTRLSGTSEHQGYLARMPPFPYFTSEELLANRLAEPFFLLLDGVQDPFNFGAIIRSAEVLGCDGIIVPERGQAEVNSHVVRASAGAVNFLPIARAQDLVAIATELRETGLTLVAASEKGDLSPSECDLRGPLALVIGNEGSGIRPELLERCDRSIRIPQSGRVGSLNAAVAAGILLYEAHRQRAASTAPPHTT